HDSEFATKALRLLENFLDRGKDCPLHLVIHINVRPFLELLTRHSERWKTADFLFRSPSTLQHLSYAKGRLPLLETLIVLAHEGPPRTKEVNPFETTPRLRSLVISGAILPSFANPPLAQLDSVGYLDLGASDIAVALETMSRMAHGTAFRLGLYVTDAWPPEYIGLLDLPPTSSNIVRLSIEILDVGFLDKQEIIQILSHTVATLTLPHLHELSFLSEQFPSTVMYWPQTAFLDLAARSSFDNHLHSLRLLHVAIADMELIACLLALPVLESLAISDHEIPWPNTFDHHLVTDTLFSKLTLRPDSPPIVPRLRSLLCRTRLEFDDTVFLEFLLSRRVEQPDSPLLICEMFCLPGCRRGLESAVAGRVQDLRIRKEVIVVFSEVEEEEF
ncbi:hypothetical protein B0H12DRAFT_1142621, partial [Mycena haematopus]